jgi:hypothetical protein
VKRVWWAGDRCASSGGWLEATRGRTTETELGSTTVSRKRISIVFSSEVWVVQENARQMVSRPISLLTTRKKLLELL